MQITPLYSKTTHIRKGNGENKFNYSFLSYLITSSDGSVVKPWWLSINKLGIFSIRENDYFQVGDLNLSLRERIENFIGTDIIDYNFLCGGRFLNYIFNPVSFYFVETKDHKRKLVVEIWNTFGEFKPLVIDEVGGEFKVILTKNFYVSPFLPMDTKITIKAKYPTEYLGNIYIISEKEGERVYADWRVEPLGNRLIVLFPYSFKVSIAIHFQALRLFFKKIKFYKKNDNQEQQIGFYIWNK